MPKTFTESEREYIKQRLRNEAQICLGQFGVRKTTVDELVKRVNIPKGTFYIFYDTKEALFFDVFNEFHEELQSSLINQIDSIKNNINSDKVTELIFNLYKEVEASFLFPLMTNGDIELIMRKLSAKDIEEHANKDDLSIEKLIVSLGIGQKNIKTFSAALRAVFLSMLHKREIGDDAFGEALKVMIKGIVIQMFQEDVL